MDIYIDILLPKASAELPGLEEQYYLWGEEKISFSPRKFKWGNCLSFVMNEVHPLYEKITKKSISIVPYNIYTLNDNVIYEWEKNVNKKNKNNNTLKEFILKYLSKFESWGVAISFDEDIIDGIDEFLLFNNEKELIDKIEKAINWNNGRGFIGYKGLSSEDYSK